MADYPDGAQLVQVAVTVANEVVLPTPSAERAVAGYGSISTSSASYQTVTSWTVAVGKVGVLCEVEMACDNYPVAVWKLVVGSVTVYDGVTLQSYINKRFPDLRLAAGELVTISVKSNGSTTVTAYADIDCKEQG